MDKADESTIYYIGGKNSWFFIGTKADYDEEFLAKREDKLNQLIDQLYDIKRAYEVCRVPLPLKREDWMTDKVFARYQAKREQAMESYNERKSKLLRSMELKQEQIKAYTEFDDAEILTEYDKTASPGKALIVDTDITGRFWTKEEYDRAKGVV